MQEAHTQAMQGLQELLISANTELQKRTYDLSAMDLQAVSLNAQIEDLVGKGAWEWKKSACAIVCWISYAETDQS